MTLRSINVTVAMTIVRIKNNKTNFKKEKIQLELHPRTRFKKLKKIPTILNKLKIMDRTGI